MDDTQFHVPKIPEIDKFSAICGYLDAIVEVNLKTNIINDYILVPLGTESEWQHGLGEHLDYVSASGWFTKDHKFDSVEVAQPLDGLSDAFLDWIFVFLGTGSDFGGYPEYGFKASSDHFNISDAEGKKNMARKVAAKILSLTNPKQVLRVRIEASCSGYIFGHCFVLVNEQQTWWLRLGAVC